MKSSVVSALDDRQIPLRISRTDHAIDPALVVKQATMLGAIKLCISAAGFENDKQLYRQLDIDASHWTRITNGAAHFPVDKLPALMNLCGNEAPLIWLTAERGYDPASLRKRESEIEKRLRETEDRVRLLEHDKRVLTEALRGGA